jgi:hypothetical protein
MVFSKQKNKFYSSLILSFFRSQKRSRTLFVSALTLIVLLSLLSQTVLAAPTVPSAVSSIGSAAGGVLVGMAAALITPVLQVITFFCALLVDIAAHFLSFMLQPNLYNFTTEPIIVQGWKAVRDVCNLFFLLILLFIAFCTILQIEKYHLKKNLLTLVIMALLINFSKPIAIFIFDGAQLMMNYFLGAIGDYGTTATNLSQIANIIYKDLPGFTATVISAGKGTGGFTGSAIQYLFAIIFMFMYATSLIVIGIYLLIRIVALWLIVIVSPLAFLAMAVPDFKKMSSQWWDALFKYSYVGPAMAFFLWLSTRLATSFFVTTARNFKGTVNIISMSNFISFATIIVFLYASIVMAQKFGIQFASAITNYADKAMRFGTGLSAAQWGGRKIGQGAKYAAKAGLKKFDRDVLGKWSPRAFIKGWQKSSEDIERRHLEPAAAGWEDSINKFFGRKKPKGYAANVQFEADVEKEMKEQRNISTQDSALIGVIEKFKGDKSQEARAKTAAAMRLLFESNDQNEFMKQYALVDEDFAALGLDSNNPEDLKKGLDFALKRVGMDENQRGRQLFQMGNIALSKGNLANYGMGIYDSDSEQYRISSQKEQMDYSQAKARNIDVQEKMKRLHWNAIFSEGVVERDANGDVVYEQDIDEFGQPKVDGTGKIIMKAKMTKVGSIHQTGFQLLADMKQAEITQLNRARPDLIENCYYAKKQIEEYSKKLAEKAETAKNAGDTKAEEQYRMQSKNVKAFHDKIVEQFEAKKKGGEESQKKEDRTAKDDYDLDY